MTQPRKRQPATAHSNGHMTHTPHVNASPMARLFSTHPPIVVLPIGCQPDQKENGHECDNQKRGGHDRTIAIAPTATTTSVSIAEPVRMANAAGSNRTRLR